MTVNSHNTLQTPLSTSEIFVNRYENMYNHTVGVWWTIWTKYSKEITIRLRRESRFSYFFVIWKTVAAGFPQFKQKLKKSNGRILQIILFLKISQRVFNLYLASKKCKSSYFFLSIYETILMLKFINIITVIKIDNRTQFFNKTLKSLAWMNSKSRKAFQIRQKTLLATKY